MGLISGYNQNLFVSAEQIYSKIKREFKSFTGSNLIDDGEFPTYTAEILKFLGVGALREARAIIELVDNKASLPKDFKELYAAYNCEKHNSSTEVWRGQGESSIRQDITCEVYGQRDNCNICCEQENLIQKVTTQMFIKDTCYTDNFSNLQLLRVSPNVHSMCSTDCANIKHTSNKEITFDNGIIKANFSGNIYMEYYAFPLDCDGLPMVPDNLKIQKAIEWYIKYQILLNFWFSDDVSNIQNKWSKAEQEYNRWLNEARHELKLPAFATLMNEARNKRANNMLSFFSNQYNR
jgi:hypothetical protein